MATTIALDLAADRGIVGDKSPVIPLPPSPIPQKLAAQLNYLMRQDYRLATPLSMPKATGHLPAVP